MYQKKDSFFEIINNKNDRLKIQTAITKKLKNYDLIIFF